MIDKCRAMLAGKHGAYNYDCPLDQEFLSFAGINAEELRRQIASGKGDGEILEWINACSKTKPNPAAIAAWSAHQELRAPTDPEMREFFQDEHKRLAPKRSDLSTWFDLLDLDDYVSFGGQP
jgi:hypothetical protein